jgi:hypothetical protein
METETLGSSVYPLLAELRITLSHDNKFKVEKRGNLAAILDFLRSNPDALQSA